MKHAGLQVLALRLEEPQAGSERNLGTSVFAKSTKEIKLWVESVRISYWLFMWAVHGLFPEFRRFAAGQSE